MVSLTIDGRTISVPEGNTILEAARELGISIPTLCWLEKISPTGACRVCAVEIEGVERPMTACNTPVKDGIKVTTSSERLEELRRKTMELMLVNHPVDCPVCDAGGECDLQDMTYQLQVNQQGYAAENVLPAPIESWPLIKQVPSRCILCEKCVKVCHEVVGASALVVRNAGDQAFIDTHDGRPLDCEFCGNCVEACPTGTLLSRHFLHKARPWELRTTHSVCTQCGSQCEIDIHVKNNRIYRITSEDGVTANNGNLCIGGYFGFGYVNSEQRLQSPQLRDTGQAEKTDWETALSTVAGKAREIRESHGGGALAGLASARLTNEESYLFQKLFRVALGSNNIDSDARFGALRAVNALKAPFGLTGASNRMDRIGQCDAVLVFGGDATAEAPAIDWQIEISARKRNGKLVVAGLREVKLTRLANTQLTYRPGSEIALANALAAIMLEKKIADQDYLERYVKNFKEIKAHLAKIDIEQAVSQTGLSRELLEEAALHLGGAEAVAVVLGSDLLKTDQAEEKVRAVANLALVSGALHGDIGGLFPIAEKGNTQGLIDMGVCPEYLPGVQDYSEARGRFETLWKTKLPEGGRNALAILEGIEKGEVRFLYLAAVNPLVAFPESARWRKALEKLDCLVVQDILPAEVTRLAHVVLPGSSFAEKNGSVTSLDNRVSCLKPALKLSGEAREDWDILADLYARLAPKEATLNAEDLLEEVKEAAPVYSEVCFPAVGRCRPCLKPVWSPEFHSLEYIPAKPGKPAEGLQLLAGKILFHFGTTTTFAPEPLAVAPEGYVEINPADAKKIGVEEGAEVKLTSATGAAQGKVRISKKVPEGLLFSPSHFSDLNINQLIPAGNNLASVEISKV